MKIYAIPITRERIAYYCHSSHKPSGVAGKLISKATEKWNLLSQSPKGSYKHKCFVWCSDMLDKIDAREWFLKSIPPIQKNSPVSKIEIFHPSSLISSQIQKDLKNIISERVLLHRRYFFLTSVVIPLTSLVSLLPIPNIPFLYASFRGYSHYFAYQGGKHLDILFKKDLVTYSTSSKLDRHLEGKFLADLEPHCEITKVKEGQVPTPEATTYSLILKWLCEDLDLPKLNVEVSRAIKQLKLSQNNQKLQ